MNLEALLLVIILGGAVVVLGLGRGKKTITIAGGVAIFCALMVLLFFDSDGVVCQDGKYTVAVTPSEQWIKLKRPDGVFVHCYSGAFPKNILYYEDGDAITITGGEVA